MRWVRSRLAAAVLAGSVVTACGQYRVQIDRPFGERAKGFSVGSTRYGETLSVLGPPAKMTRSVRGFTFLYEHVAVHEAQLAWDLGWTKIPLMKLLKLGGAWAHANYETLLLVFGEDGVLRDSRILSGSKDLGSGFVFGPVFVSERVFDVDDYRKKAKQHGWGRRLLGPISEQLNSRQNLYNGISGLEQRGTPGRIGQQMTIPRVLE